MTNATVNVGKAGAAGFGFRSERGLVYLAVAIAVVALLLGALSMALVHDLRLSAGPAGPAGANGANGRNGTNGMNGTNGSSGTPGTGTTWGTLTLDFTIGGRGANVSVVAAVCTEASHGAYACNVTLASTANLTQRVSGLSYAPNPNVYYAGADPTLGWIFVPANGTTTFTLWFQEVAPSGNSTVDVTLFLAAAPHGASD